MFKPKKESQNEAEFVFIEDLVPEDHLLRKVDKYIDFSFIGEKVRPFYSEKNGRPSDPIMLFKMMFIGYFYGIRSERQLEREVQLNVAYRWFLGLKLHDPFRIIQPSVGTDELVLRIQTSFKKSLMKLSFKLSIIKWSVEEFYLLTPLTLKQMTISTSSLVKK